MANTPSPVSYTTVTLTDPTFEWISIPFMLINPPVVVDWHLPRRPSWRVEVLDLSGEIVGSLAIKTGGASLDWADRVSPAGGKVDVEGAIDGKSPRDALTGKRVRPIYSLDGTDYPMGLLKPARIPTAHRGGGMQVHSLSLVSATAITQRTRGALTYPAATPIVSTVRALAAAAGVPYLIEASDATLRTEASFADNTPIQQVCDALLKAAGFTPLRPTKADGIMRSAMYVPPADREVAFDFRNDDRGIYRPEFTIDSNWLEVPNRIRAVARSSSGAEALTGYAEDNNPASPWSFAVRGEWVEETVPDVDATSQEAANLIASRELVSRQQSAATLSYQCAWVPALQIGAVVGFYNTTHAVSGLWEITALSWEMSPKSLVSVTARSVA